MHPIPGRAPGPSWWDCRSKGQRAHALRAVRQFAWLEVGSVKVALSRPAWLDLAHKRLDEAAFTAYGWPSDLSDQEILERLLALNLERAKG